MTASCSCGRVELKASGAPIVSSVCYCDDCQKGSRQIEELPNAGPVRDPDGGTAYILYRKDRIECSKGAALLKSYKIKDNSVTNRVVATCCNSAMFMNFDKGPFWVSRLQNTVPGRSPAPPDAHLYEVQARHCCSSERCAQLLGLPSAVHGEAPGVRSGNAVASMRPARRCCGPPTPARGRGSPAASSRRARPAAAPGRSPRCGGAARLPSDARRRTRGASGLPRRCRPGNGH